MGNTDMKNAKAAKKDEFYTQWPVIEAEINAYLDYDPNVFRGKTVLLPCDDPEWSKFTRFFAEKFTELGLRKLISTSYAPDSKRCKVCCEPSLFEQNAPQFDPKKTNVRGKIFVLDRDVTGDGKIDLDDLRWEYLEGDGDFRSDEVKRLRDEADIVVTNPPFSLFRAFLAWVMEAEKKFIIIGSLNAVTYKEMFPLIMQNQVWMGCTIHSGDREFQVPDDYPLEAAGWRVDADGRKYIRVKGVRWFTNIDHGRRHEPLQLMPQADVFRFSKHKNMRGRTAFDAYDNYDAIDVPYSDNIPSDFDGVMGVPISFLDKYCPEQFEILGITDRQNTSGLRTKKYTAEDSPKYNDLNARSVIKSGDIYIPTYARILIRRK